MMIDDFKKRFYISLALTIPVLLISPMVQDILGFSLTFPGDSYLLFGLSSVIFFYGGWPFLTGLVDEIKAKTPGMMTLIALAITIAYGYSTLVVFGWDGNQLFWELATLVVMVVVVVVRMGCRRKGRVTREGLRTARLKIRNNLKTY